jgi:hypothetical protein
VERPRTAAKKRKNKHDRWAMLIVERDGEAHFAMKASRVAAYVTRRAAERDAAFLRKGLGDRVLSVNVVPYLGRPPAT